MIDEGIHHGDYLIVEPCSTAENGQTVVAEIDGCVTVKKYHRDPNGDVRLQPANPEMLPLVIRGENMRIIGVVAGVLRKLGFNKSHALPAVTDSRLVPEDKRAAVHRRPVVAHTDSASLELAVNVMDRPLTRWQA